MATMLENVTTGEAMKDTSVPLSTIAKRSRAHPPHLHVVVVQPERVIGIPVNKQWAGDEFHHIKEELLQMANDGALVAAPIASIASPAAEVGKGAYGVVHRGVLVEGKQVAIKKFYMCRYDADGDSVTIPENALDDVLGGNIPTFHELPNLKEAVALFKLDHPNIVKLHKLVYDEETDPDVGRLYLMMEFATGTSLGIRLSQDRHFLSTEIAQVTACKELASAVAYIHGRGFMHRDLNAFNVLVSSEGALQVADFGLCTDDQPDSGRLRSMAVQNILCRSPEIVFRYTAYTNAIDVWSLGVLFYLIFMRRHLFFLTSKDDENALLRMMILHFGPIPAEWMLAMLPACLPGWVDYFEPTIVAANKEFAGVQREPYVTTTIASPTAPISKIMSFLFREMMNYNHTARPTASQVSSYLDRMFFT